VIYSLPSPIGQYVQQARKVASASDERIGLLMPLTSNVGAVIAGLASLKVITGSADSSDYGLASLALGLIALLSGALSGPMLAAQLRMSFQAGRLSSLAAGIRCASISGAAFAGVAVVYALAGQWTYLSVVGPAILLIVAQVLSATLMNESERAGKRAWHAAISIASRSGPLIAFCLPWSLWKAGHGGGVLLAMAIGPMLSLVAIWGLRGPGGGESTVAGSPTCSIVGLTGSLQAAFVAHWFLSTADRYILSAQRSPVEAGIYVMNYGAWSMPLQVLNGTLETVFRRSMYRSAEAGEFDDLWRVTGARMAAGAGLSIVWLLVLPWVMGPLSARLFGPQFMAPGYVIVVISSAHVFLVAGYALVAFHIALRKMTPVVWATVIGAATCVAYDIVFIPNGGMRAAAEGTLMGYLTWFGVLSARALRWRAGLALPVRAISVT
jgi:O-antigen/teichoic acid export membrane protein